MDPLALIRHLFAFPFMVNAFEAGTTVAILGAVVGWFMVLRRQTFAGHTLALVGFPGATGATLVKWLPAVGFFGFCIAAALVIAASGWGQANSRRQGGRESAVIGTVQALALAGGFLFVSLYRGNIQGIAALLFGTLLGITRAQVVLLGITAALTLIVLGVVARPLLFASVDPDVAVAAGVPARHLDVLFLVVLGATAAETSQITGSLLVFALLVAPAATAQVMTPRPGLSLVLAVLIGLCVTWLGMALAYFGSYPVGFTVSSLAFTAYLLAIGTRWLHTGALVACGRGRQQELAGLRVPPAVS